LKAVNYQETKRRFDASGRSASKFARAHNLAPTTFSKFLNGDLTYSQGEKFGAMVDALREADCLVEEDDEAEAA